LRIKTVETKKDFKDFLEFPEEIYVNDANWVPKLDMDINHLLGDENPFYEHAFKKLFIAERDGKTVGRIAAVIDYNYVEFHGENAGFFGFFECEDNPETAKLLFDSCEKILKEKGMEKIIGPMNPSSNDECGFLLEGFDLPPRLMMPYNHKYYLNLIENAGYNKAKDLVALNMEVSSGPQQRLKKVIERIQKRNPGLYSRPLNKKDFKGEVEKIRSIYNKAWEKNWGFVPWTEDELNDMAKQLKPLVVPGLAQIGFDGNKPIGFLLALPDYNEVIKKIGRKLFPLGWLKFILLKNKINNLRLMAMGVKHEYQNKGIGAVMYYNSLLEAGRLGFKECEFSWILEDNLDTIKIGQMMGGEVYKKYRIFEKCLT